MEQSTAEVKQDETQTQTPEPPQQDGSVESAAQALAGLLNDDGLIPEESEEAAPQGKAEPQEAPEKVVEQAPADEAKVSPISLKIGDKEYTIPASDIPEEIRDVVKDGLLMRADYTRKTQELAEQRKTIESHAQSISTAMQTVQAFPQHMAAIQHVEAQLQQFQNPELWQRLEADPLGKIEAKQAYQDLQNQRQNLYGRLNQAQQEVTVFQAQQNQERLKQAMPAVKRAIPDFGPEKVKALREFAKDVGFTDQQLNHTYDAAPLILLNMAMEYAKLQTTKAAVTQKVEKLPPKTQKAGVGQTPGTGSSMNQAAMQRLRKSGSLDDAQAAIKSILG